MEDLENCNGDTTICVTATVKLHVDSNDSAKNGSQLEVSLGQTVLIGVYSLTTALSVVGNIMAIIVFSAGRRSRTDLRWFLINLAVADLIMAVFCMPFSFTMAMLGYWIFSAPMCPIVLFLQTVSVTASVFTSVAVGVDRYWVVNFPLKSRITKSRSPLVIAAIWTAACILSSVQLIVGRSNAQTLPGGQQVLNAQTFIYLAHYHFSASFSEEVSK